MNKQQLASKIWESANKMRSKIEANEYKDYILGFIFYKFLSDKEVKYLKELGYTDEDIDTVTEEDQEIVVNVQKNIGYFISYKDLFSTWLDMGSDFNVANVRDALSAFSRLINASHKKVFTGVFDTLQTGLSKLGDSSNSQTKAISDLLHLIKDIPMDGKQDYDVLGFIYEYLISNFAANAGKKAGEFYTPHEVSLLMSEIVADHLNDRSEIKIYDPTSGSGSLLINIGKAIEEGLVLGNGVIAFGIVSICKLTEIAVLNNNGADSTFLEAIDGLSGEAACEGVTTFLWQFDSIATGKEQCCLIIRMEDCRIACSNTLNRLKTDVALVAIGESTSHLIELNIAGHTYSLRQTDGAPEVAFHSCTTRINRQVV